MDWAKETRLARWRRRAAATVLAMVVLIGAFGGAVSGQRAKVLQNRLESGQVEYVYQSDTPFRQAERLVKSGGGTLLNHRVSSVSEVPSPWASRSWVADTAGVLSPTAVLEINGLATDIQRKTGAELVVVTVPGIQGAQEDRKEVKRFTTRLFNSWHLGDRYKNNGLLVLVSTGDRRVEVEIGKGLNQVMNREEWLQKMMKSRMTPFLRQNLYSQGVTAGVSACSEKLLETDREVSSPQSWRHRSWFAWAASGLSALGLGGLVASVRRPPRCSCGARMGKLRRAEEEELEDGQRAEMQLGSVKHILCGCGRPGCQKLWSSSGVRSLRGAQRMGGAVRRSRQVSLAPEEVVEVARQRTGLGILSEPDMFSRFQTCQACGYRTALSRTVLFDPPTSWTTGYRERCTECFFCAAEFTDWEILPMLPRVSSSSGSDGGGGGVSSGGGSGFDF